MSEVSPRIWPVKPGMRVQVWLSSRVGVLDEREETGDNVPKLDAMK